MADRQIVIPTVPGMGRGLVNHDPRSMEYRAVELTDQTKPRTRHHRRGLAYNQGSTSMCVAYTAVGILNTVQLSRNVAYRIRSRYPFPTFYKGAQSQDEWAGEAYDGTSGLGMCRWLKANGYISEYRWCFGLDDVKLTLSWVGPVGIGVGWREGMWNTDDQGYLHVTGPTVGGHEVELTGIDVDDEYVVVTNSWGREWGVNGKAKLSFADLELLLADNGDALVITR